jgi:hypothetical protein
MNGAIQITFGPGIDILFVTFLITGVAVFIGVLSNWIIAEIRDIREALAERRVAREKAEKEILEDLEETFRDPENDGWMNYASSNDEPVKAHYHVLEDGTVVNNFSGEKVEPESEMTFTTEVTQEYLVQWGELEDFSRRGRIDLIKTTDPRATAKSLIEKYDKGYIRWRLAGDDVVAPDWHNIGFFAAAFAEGVYDHRLPKEKING